MDAIPQIDDRTANQAELFRMLPADRLGRRLIAKGADVFQVDRQETEAEIPSALRAIVTGAELALGNVGKR